MHLWVSTVIVIVVVIFSFTLEMKSVKVELMAILVYCNILTLDAEKQDAINLFLGNYIAQDGKPPLWELSSDYHLHNEDPRQRTKRRQ
jgi:hypothetical protein